MTVRSSIDGSNSTLIRAGSGFSLRLYGYAAIKAHLPGSSLIQRRCSKQSKSAMALWLKLSKHHCALPHRKIYVMYSMTHVFPPPQGSRRTIFCGSDDILWATRDGEITSGIVQPKKSIWISFKGTM